MYMYTYIYICVENELHAMSFQNNMFHFNVYMYICLIENTCAIHNISIINIYIYVSCL